MDKRYQVFVSSTFEDLREERQRVIEAVLGCECIPVGMEYFPAGDESQWELIKRVIRDCDYYVVIVAGRYGSIANDEKSYTQKEYEYAVESEVPVMAFIHGEPGDIPSAKSESDSGGKEKLEEFRQLCKKRMCKAWTTPEGLAGQVAISLNQMKSINPRVGWIKADKVPEDASGRILRLTQSIDELKSQLRKVRTEPPAGIEELAQAEDTVTLRFRYSFVATTVKETVDQKIELTWDKIFGFIAPNLLVWAGEHEIKSMINKLIESESIDSIRRKLKGVHSFFDFRCVEDDFNTIKIQLRSLGLIERSAESIAWRLTRYGDQVMVQLRAMKRSK